MSDPVPAISHLFQKMEEKKDIIFSLVNPLSREEYLRQPFPGSWSAGQAANHLFLSEKHSLAYLRKKISYPETIPPFHLKSWLGLLTYKFFMAFKKVKAPSSINMWEGQEVLMPEALEEKWNLLRQEMRSFLQEHYPQFKNHLVYKHPFAGRLTLKQMLMFFNDHLDHHTKQVKRILKEIHNR